MKKKILLTGGSGFIGKNIIEQLGNKYHILAPKHAELDLADDVATLSYFKFHNTIDLVIHAAVVGGSRTEEYEKDSLKNNLRIFFNIIKNRKHVKKIIYFGSGAEYDKTKPIKKVKEKDFDKRVPQDDYGFFKYLCSKYSETVKQFC